MNFKEVKKDQNNRLTEEQLRKLPRGSYVRLGDGKGKDPWAIYVKSEVDDDTFVCIHCGRCSDSLNMYQFGKNPVKVNILNDIEYEVV